jgi:choline dehydrogenase-like flavoprotein
MAGVQVFGTTIPTEGWYVKPDDTGVDRFGMPLLDIHMEYDEDVVCNVIRARGHLLQLMEEAGYRCSLGKVAPQLSPGASVHYGGTVRMHDNPSYGMLDSWNRLHEVPNVAVVDASCFTTGPEKNPTLTAMALAARAAERLASDLKSGAALSRAAR